MNEIRHVAFETSAGWIGVSGSARGLRRVTLPQTSAEAAIKLLGADAVTSTGMFADLARRLGKYFDGRKVPFPDDLDLSGATEFQRRVWQVAKVIPYGETRSYAWVAKQVGRPLSSRAVGQALGRNPLPIIIPCHRVITAGGRVGGYSGGARMKERLLQLEFSAS